MTRNSRTRPRHLHAALAVGRSGGASIVWKVTKRLTLLTLAVALVIGLSAGLSKLHDLWIEQCVVTDAKTQISVAATPHIAEEYIREWFGLTNGCNLALIDFDAQRARVLRDHPIVRDLTITRRLPNRLSVSLEERKPIARVNYRETTSVRGGSGSEAKNVRVISNWDVTDTDGIVFEYSKKDSKDLPLITSAQPVCRRGERLTGRTRTALRFIELATVRGLMTHPLSEVSDANAVYLRATLNNYSLIRIDWRILDDPANPRQEKLAHILGNVQSQLNEGLFPDRCTFTITDPDRIAILPFEEGALVP